MTSARYRNSRKIRILACGSATTSLLSVLTGKYTQNCRSCPAPTHWIAPDVRGFRLSSVFYFLWCPPLPVYCEAPPFSTSFVSISCTTHSSMTSRDVDVTTLSLFVLCPFSHVWTFRLACHAWPSPDEDQAHRSFTWRGLRHSQDCDQSERCGIDGETFNR